MINKLKKSLSSKKGFTLIELLVVISIIGILSAIIVINLQDARARARDAKTKSNIKKLETALRMYYNDYQEFPDECNGGGKYNVFEGCGTNGNSCCGDTSTCSNVNFGFAAGTNCETIYMNAFPEEFGSSIYYKHDDTTDKYCLYASLENASDPDITKTKDQCESACTTANGGSNPLTGSSDYAACSN